MAGLFTANPMEEKPMRAYVEERTQKARGTWPRQGPDTYVAVQIVPAGITKLKILRDDTAEERGIELVICGEGYYNRTGPQSMLGIARKKAHDLAEEINKEAPLLPRGIV